MVDFLLCYSNALGINVIKAGLIPFKGFLLCKENGFVGYCVKYLDCSHEILVQSTPPMPNKVLWKQWDDVGKHLPHWQIGLVMIRGDLKDITMRLCNQWQSSISTFRD